MTYTCPQCGPDANGEEIHTMTHHQLPPMTTDEAKAHLELERVRAQERPPMAHALKVWPQFLPSLTDGSKPFEARKFDRDYRVGDTLHLYGWDPKANNGAGAHTGWVQSRLITYMLIGPAFGVEDGWAILGMAPPPERPYQRTATVMPRHVESLTPRDTGYIPMSMDIHDPMGHPPEAAKPPAPAPAPVCRACNDTHTIHLEETGRSVMCTHCPVPCDKCRKGGNGPYCEKTPCDCACHGKGKSALPDPAEAIKRLTRYLETGPNQSVNDENMRDLRTVLAHVSLPAPAPAGEPPAPTGHKWVAVDPDSPGGTWQRSTWRCSRCGDTTNNAFLISLFRQCRADDPQHLTDKPQHLE